MCPFEWAYHWGRDVESPLLHKKPEFRSDLDIAVCKVREHPAIGPYQPLNIGLYNLKLGDRAVAIGYPEMRNIRLGGNRNVQLRVEMFNAPNAAIITNRNTTLNLNNPTDPVTATNLPYDANGNVIAARSLPRGAGFGVATAYQDPRTVQAQVRFSF